MSKYISDITNLIRSNPQEWTPLSGNSIYRGMTNGLITIKDAGLGYFMSIVEVHIGNSELSLMRWDRFRIELAVAWWYRNCSLSKMELIEPQP